jgi:hypothetical protein
VTVSELMRLNNEIKDAPTNTSKQDESVVFHDGMSKTGTTFDSMKVETFTKEEYMKLVQEWANLRKINTSFGAS